MGPSNPSQLDLRGCATPLVPLLVRQALAGLEPGQTLEVLLSSVQWARDLPRIVERGGDCCLLSEFDPLGYRLLLARGREFMP